MMGPRQLLLLFSIATASAATVTLAPSIPSPAPLGTVVTFSATTIADEGATYAYRFRTRRVFPRTSRRAVEPGYRTVVDFGPKTSLDWTTIDGEGPYEVEVSARNNMTGDVLTDVTAYQFTRVTEDAPAVTPTRHPLVFLYSAPPCALGSSMWVRFAPSDNSAPAQQTPVKDCDGRTSMNFYLAGLRAATRYTAWQAIATEGPVLDGPQVTFTTGAVTLLLPQATPLSTPVPDTGTVLLQSVLNGRSIATDLNGNLLWYSPAGLSLITRMSGPGTMLGILEDGSRDTSAQIFREFDLLGITMAETNAARVNEQLRAAGARPITSFHHEAIRLADGSYLVLAGTEQILTDVQGQGDTNILGDMILVLDRDLQVQWFWDAFNYFDVTRPALLNETCSYPASLACSAFYDATLANDWLHGNSLQLTPDGNILYSVRHQDWVVKIDYRNGSGTGNILWKLGAGGDFTLTSGNDLDWFSHQHDAQILPDGTLMLFDNGNTRIFRNTDQGTSRGQIWQLDEEAHTATLLFNADLKVNSAALGTGQVLANGNYHFDAGFIPAPGNPNQRISQALELDPSGNIVWGMQINAQEYRSYRLTDLYTPPVP